MHQINCQFYAILQFPNGADAVTAHEAIEWLREYPPDWRQGAQERLQLLACMRDEDRPPERMLGPAEACFSTLAQRLDPGDIGYGMESLCSYDLGDARIGIEGDGGVADPEVAAHLVASLVAHYGLEPVGFISSWTQDPRDTEPPGSTAWWCTAAGVESYSTQEWLAQRRSEQQAAAPSAATADMSP